MKLSKEEQKICDKYGAYDKTGYVHCNQCPLVINARHCVCKKNISREEYNKYWK